MKEYKYYSHTHTWEDSEKTAFDISTPVAVMDILENSRITQKRLHIYYGDVATGKEWGDIDKCHIGRSTGEIKIPLVISNKRSTGGGGLLDNCIVKITTSTKPYTILYKI